MSGFTRDAFEALWAKLDADAQAEKFSQGTVLRLADFYRQLDEEDRRVVNEVLASWVRDGDARRRFDALALIDHFDVRSALPAVQADLERLSSAVGPSVASDRAQLERIIARLQPGSNR